MNKTEKEEDIKKMGAFEEPAVTEEDCEEESEE